MAQLRQDYQQFVDLDTEIIVIGPEDKKAFADYWAKEDMPFIGCPDPDHNVASVYGQEVKLLKFGRMPAMMIIDKKGAIRYSHYGDTMRDIPDNAEVLNFLRLLNGESQNSMSRISLN